VPKAKYLGETPVQSLEGTPFEGYTPADWAKHYIDNYGGIDGEHHKTWVLDQVMLILHGTPVLVRLAKWDDGTEEYRYTTDEPSTAYQAWIKSRKKDGYDWDEGIAP
jgi:hypothetical protein